jgi:hypothetical protein
MAREVISARLEQVVVDAVREEAEANNMSTSRLIEIILCRHFGISRPTRI